MLKLKEGGGIEDRGTVEGAKPKPRKRHTFKVANCGGAKTRAKIPWTHEEYEFLVKNWYMMGSVRVSVELNRETGEVEGVAKKLGLVDPELLLDKTYRRLAK